MLDTQLPLEVINISIIKEYTCLGEVEGSFWVWIRARVKNVFCCIERMFGSYLSSGIKWVRVVKLLFWCKSISILGCKSYVV